MRFYLLHFMVSIIVRNSLLLQNSGKENNLFNQVFCGEPIMTIGQTSLILPDTVALDIPLSWLHHLIDH